ncbi:MAG: hypothetical protein GYB68_10740, partial [Chloroflexi bacterium]|nr:hypothetical protein [Chloroflexota bacterium]
VGTPSAASPPQPVPTWTPTSPPPTATVTAVPQEQGAPTLNPAAEPNFGSFPFPNDSGRDPFALAIVSGGRVNVGALGAGCIGFASIAPDVVMSWSGDGFLRFFVVPQGLGDTALVIQEPGGTLACNDDSFDTLNPTLSYDPAPPGLYRVWVASLNEGTSIDGTLFVTRNAEFNPAQDW